MAEYTIKNNPDIQFFGIRCKPDELFVCSKQRIHFVVITGIIVVVATDPKIDSGK